MKLVKITKLTNERFLNLYDLEYEHEGKTIHWTMASRNEPDQMVCSTGKDKADTVCIVPRVRKDGKEYIVLTREYRQPIGDYVYSFPAGLVEAGENPLDCCARELEEEIGAVELAEVKQLSNVCYNSEGMTDESVVMFEVVVTKFGKQNLQDHEDINMIIVPMEEVEDFIKDKRLSTRAGIYLPMMAREYALEKQIEALKSQSTPTGNGK